MTLSSRPRTPSAKTPEIVLPSRSSMVLIGEVGTVSQNFKIKIHALPKDEETTALLKGMKRDPDVFQPDDHNESFCSYLSVLNGTIGLRPGRETWHHVAWEGRFKQEKKGWARLGLDSENEAPELGSMGLPYKIRYGLNDSKAHEDHAAKIGDPGLQNILKDTHFYYKHLSGAYAVNSVIVNAGVHHINWFDFRKQNHPKYHVSKIAYPESDRQQLERMPKGAGKYADSEILDDDEAAPIWQQVLQFHRSVPELCAHLKVPDVSTLIGTPVIIEDINALNLDAVMGNFCPELLPTYKRLGMKYGE